MIHGRVIIPALAALLYLALYVLIYQRLKLWYGHKTSWKAIQIVYFTSLILVLAGLTQALFRLQSPPINPSWFANYFVGFTFSIMVGSILYGIVLAIDASVGIPFWLSNILQSKPNNYSPTRRKFVQSTSTVVAGLPFLSLIQGITFGKYDYQVRNISLSFEDLPEAFHGFKIAQISDIHSGSFDSKSAVQRGVDLVNAQGADLIAFTGDLVNSMSKEIQPFIPVFKQLKAPYGVLSTKGNHDYGLYYTWESEKQHRQDQQLMLDYHNQLGFDLLNNENRIIEKDGQQIAVVGVENWGLPPFPQAGDLNRALQGVENTPFTILLSHDPSHWDEEVLKHSRHIHLTLAGHTHGMQFGVEIPGFKWSPVKYRYPRWAGLYKEMNQYLYVNRGFGFIGFPGRVGIRPEITVIELQRA